MKLTIITALLIGSAAAFAPQQPRFMQHKLTTEVEATKVADAAVDAFKFDLLDNMDIPTDASINAVSPSLLLIDPRGSK
jgi:hypothetical protein